MGNISQITFAFSYFDTGLCILVNMSSGIGLLPVWPQPITRTNADLL